MPELRHVETKGGDTKSPTAATMPEELGHLLTRWNQTDAPYPSNLCLHNLFEDQVKKTPQAIAVCFENRKLTYADLNSKANQVAHYLIKVGVRHETLVGISLERSLEMLVALLGILKAGGCYVPLDPAYPKDRLAFMLEDSQLKLLVTEKQLIEVLPGHTGQTVLLDEQWSLIAKESEIDPAIDVRPNNLAYILYTSGSTGKPKGVQIEHRSVVNFLSSMQRVPGLNSAMSSWPLPLCLSISRDWNCIYRS